MGNNDRRQLYRLFAEVLDYPNESMVGRASECAQLLVDICPKAAEEMLGFVSFAGSESLGRMEEVYTRAFDITPTTTLYVGYHLFGETYKRGAFLVRLQEEFREYGFSFGPELADHLCVLLRFASVADDPEFVDPLLAECILPVMEKMEQAFEGSKKGYGQVIGSLRSFLWHEYPSQQAVAAGGMQHD